MIVFIKVSQLIHGICVELVIKSMLILSILFRAVFHSRISRFQCFSGFSFSLLEKSPLRSFLIYWDGIFWVFEVETVESLDFLDFFGFSQIFSNFPRFLSNCSRLISFSDLNFYVYPKIEFFGFFFKNFLISPEIFREFLEFFNFLEVFLLFFSRIFKLRFSFQMVRCTSSNFLQISSRKFRLSLNHTHL